MNKLGETLDDAPSPARLERQWGRIAARLDRPRAPRALVALAAAAALAAPVAWWWSHHRAPEIAVAPARTLQLADGSTAQLSADARLTVDVDTPASVALKLAEGRGTFAVTHDAARPFVVRAGGVEVRVVGTRFSVERAPLDRVTVRVEEGIVEVRRVPSTEVRRLRAGEEATLDAAPAPAPSASTEATPIDTAPIESAAPSIPAPTARASGTAAGHDAAIEDAKQIFDRAAEARRRGDLRRAADAYQELLNRYPRDSRAGLAAFDLARLRMDSLGDVAGAIPLLERAAARGAGSIREDALARLVRAYQSQGAIKACQRAKAAYLASCPGGVHAAAVSASCP